jgi:cytidylate kinase
LKYRHLDTGAMYRAVAWKALEDRVDLADESAVAALATASTFNLDEGRVAIDDTDVTHAIRTPEIDRAATSVARLPTVRRVLVAKQRAMGAGGAIVMEGRDIGTVVFPDAHVKIYLDASPEERARRRASDPAHAASGSKGLNEVAIALAERDRNDSTRADSPLMRAADAVLIETTGQPVEAVVDRVMEVVRLTAEKR